MSWDGMDEVQCIARRRPSISHSWLWLGQIACQDARWRPGREVLRSRCWRILRCYTTT
jgi:hypothetical protein